MIFFLFIAFISPNIYSVDIGSENIRVSFAMKDGQLSIQPNSYNQRYNPNIIGFGIKDSETDIYSHKWYTGTDALIIEEQNSSRVIRNPFAYLTKSMETNTNSKSSDTKISFPLPGIHPAIASAILISANLPNFIPKTDKVIVTVPTTSSPKYRSVLRDVVMPLASIKKVSFIDKSSAIVASYLIERFNRTSRTSTDIMFIDIGTSETEISYYRLSARNTLLNAQLIDFRSTKEISGNSLDEALLRIIIKKLVSEKVVELKVIQENSQLLNELRKIAKKKKEMFVISENITINLSEECLVNPVLDKFLNLSSYKNESEIEAANETNSDKKADLSVNETESVNISTNETDTNSSNSTEAENTVKQTGFYFIVTLNETGAEICEKLEKIVKIFPTPDRVEFVGGASRFPAFTTALTNFYDENTTKVAHSLNPDEAASLGAVYYEAVRSKILYGVKLNITMKPLFGYVIRKGESEASLFDPWSNLKMSYICLQGTKDFSFSLKLNRSDKINVKFGSQNDDLNLNLNSVSEREIDEDDKDEFLVVNIKGLSEIAETPGLKNQNFIVNATFNYNSQTDSFDLSSLKTSNYVDGKKMFWEVGYEESLSDSSLYVPSKNEKIVSNAIQDLKKNLKKPTIAQRLLVLIYETLHRIKYDSDYQYVTTIDQRINTSKFLTEICSNLSTIGKNPKDIKSTHNRVEFKLRGELLRANERKERPGALSSLQIAIEKAEEAIPTATTDETAIQRFVEYFNITKIWKQVAEEVDPLQNPVILSQDIYRRANTLMGKIPSLFGPKRHVTHFRTAPPITPEPEKPKESEKVNQTETNETKIDNEANETVEPPVTENKSTSDKKNEGHETVKNSEL